EYTAAESGANAARHELWKRDLERGLPPRHITTEVEEPDQPAGWSPEDLKYQGRAALTPPTVPRPRSAPRGARRRRPPARRSGGGPGRGAPGGARRRRSPRRRPPGPRPRPSPARRATSPESPPAAPRTAPSP